MHNRYYHVVIVGAGPAALGVAEVLKDHPSLCSRTLILEKGKALDERRCAIREGKQCTSCEPCNIRSGVGGAGPYTDGKICLFEQDLGDLFRDSQGKENSEESSGKIDQYLDRVKNMWLAHGATNLRKTKLNQKKKALQEKAFRHSIKYICYPVLHIGSDGAKEVIRRYISDFTSAGITIEANSEVIAITRIDGRFEITYQETGSSNTKEMKKVTTGFLVLALGRDMQRSGRVEQLVKPLGLTFVPKSLEIGCRVEVPYQIMEDVIQITFDPKFIMIARRHQDYVRTFCTCHRGKVTREGPCVNGHVDRSKLTQNTNFAVLVSSSLKGWFMEDAMEYGNWIARMALSQGKRKPIIQRLGDLRNGIASTAESIKKSYIEPTLKLDELVTPGDMLSSYPGRITDDILDGLEMLNTVIPGVNNDENLLYAPEIKPSCSILLQKGVKTSVPNLYVCGDFSGHTRGIAQATCMGLMVGEDILREERRKVQS